ncbi:hypothetical protein N7462_009351 [Penicillium macrosclerotiorum]|uniref:uncharacterized protein n=1 Tax=Penicillium macrosclerotiorum TaxID=303699 RepID=UPI0025485299|nr:uncharacterized protein N7462_009351 [Penicillium macrosclerotiorum]KAJ5673912.1 hypothetical protein N7462_009351 [Penicillium macrosclerotiorum]
MASLAHRLARSLKRCRWVKGRGLRPAQEKPTDGYQGPTVSTEHSRPGGKLSSPVNSINTPTRQNGVSMP